MLGINVRAGRRRDAKCKILVQRPDLRELWRGIVWIEHCLDHGFAIRETGLNPEGNANDLSQNKKYDCCYNENRNGPSVTARHFFERLLHFVTKKYDQSSKAKKANKP